MFEQAFKNIDDVLWKEAGCTTELDYTEQTSWLLFLKYLDGLEQDKADEAARLYLAAKQESKPFDLAEFGFEFSTQDIEHHLKSRTALISPSGLRQAA